MTSPRNAPSKADRALELYERGISPDAIAERLGITPVRNVHSLIKKAKERREKKTEVVE